MKLDFAVLLVGLAACNYDSGECWLRSDDPEGDGPGDSSGSGIYNPSTGAGDSFNVPLEPQSAPGSGEDLCSSVTAECTVTWKAGSEVCNSRGVSESCTSLYQGKHASLDGAKAECERVNGVGKGTGAESCDSCRWATGAQDDCLDHCKDQCVQIWESCYDACGKDRVCRERCMQNLTACLKECERRCK